MIIRVPDEFVRITQIRGPVKGSYTRDYIPVRKLLKIASPTATDVRVRAKSIRRKLNLHDKSDAIK